MRKIVFASIWGIVMIVHAVGSDEIRVLTLESVLLEVESTNLSVLAAREGIDQAVEGVRRARAGLMPNVELVATQSRNQTVTVGLGLESFGLSRQSDPYNRFSAGVSVGVPLLDLKSIAAYRESKYVNEISEYEYQAALEDIKLALAEVYIGTSRAQQSLDLGREALARAEELLAIAENRYEAGAANQIDLLRAKLEVSSAKQVVVSRETALFENIQRLKLMLDIELGQEIQLSPVSLDPLQLVPEEDYRALLMKREDYLARLTEEDRARLLIRAAGWQRLPSLDLYAEYGYVSEEAFDDEEEDNWSVGISFSIPLFEGGKNKADKAIARSHLNQVELRLRELEQQVRKEVDISRKRLEEAESSWELANEALELAQATFEFALDRFRNGEGDNRELVEAQLGLASAETNRSDAKLIWEQGKLRYASATGELEKAL